MQPYSPYLPQNPMMQYAKGGHVAQQQRHGLAAAAEQLRRRGREGDTILAHISPKEAGILQLLGGSGTINPHTGLPEFKNFLEKAWETVVEKPAQQLGSAISKAGSWIDDTITQPILGAANDIAEALGPVGMIAATYFGGPLGAAVYGGFMAPGDDFNWKAAGTSGALSYAGGELLGGGGTNASFDYAGEFGSDPFGLGTTGTQSGIGSLEGAVSSGMPIIDGSPAGITSIPGTEAVQPAIGAQSAAAASPSDYLTKDEVMALLEDSGKAQPTIPVSDTIVAQGPSESLSELEDRLAISGPSPATSATGSVRAGIEVPAVGAGTAAPSTASGVASLAGSTIDTALGLAKSLTLKDLATLAQAGSTAMMGYGTYLGAKESKAQKKATQEALAKQEAKQAQDKATAQAIMARNPFQFERLTADDVRRYNLASGGEVETLADTHFDKTDDDLAKGGVASLRPRFLSGNGDGMSDSIRANIEGKQEARLADGEFVVPADVVSHIGNGSSKAGAQKLYAMMDRVRQARTGKTRQAPAVNARRLMPV